MIIDRMFDDKSGLFIDMLNAIKSGDVTNVEKNMKIGSTTRSCCSKR